MSTNHKLDSNVLHADIAIIGGGGGGLPAAIAAAEKGAKVLVLEKRHILGGNARMAGGLFAAESNIQKRLKINADKDSLFKTEMSNSQWKIDPRIFRTFINKSGNTIEWLEDMGVRFEGVPYAYPGQEQRVFHRPAGGGSGIVKAMVKKCGELGIQSFSKTTVKKILTDGNGTVTGLIALSESNEFRINSGCIIISTGGYAGNKELLKKYHPHYADDFFTFGLPHMGDGILMALETGAASEGLGNLMLRGPWCKGPIQLVTAAMEPVTVWVNKNGERFTDESAGFYWPYAGNALNRQPGKRSYSLFDETIKQILIKDGVFKGFGCPAGTRLTKLEMDLGIGAGKDRVKISDSLKDIAEWIGASPVTLKNTIDEYNLSCDGKHDEIFSKDRKYLLPLLTPPFYALKCSQSLLATAGGIKINDRMEVLNNSGNPIPGLYAAGNDTGGWQSDTYCLALSGSAFGFAVNSGRIAGENACKFALKE